MPRFPISSLLLPAGRLISTESIILYSGLTTGALSANVQYWWPLVAPKTMTVAQLWFRINVAAGSGGLANIGLYDDAAGPAMIGALLGSVLAVPIDGAAGHRVHTLSAGIPVVGGGVYWMSIQPNAAFTITAHTLREDVIGRPVGSGIATGAYSGGVFRAWNYTSGLRVTNPVDWSTKGGAYCGGIVTV